MVLDGDGRHGDPGVLISRARERLKELLKRRRPMLDAKLASTWDQAIAIPFEDCRPRDGSLPAESGPLSIESTTHEGFFPAWRERDGRLTLLFIHRELRDGTRSRLTWPCPPPCPRGAPCPRFVKGWREMTEHRHAQVETGVEVTFDRVGKILRERVFEPVASTRFPGT